LTNCNSKYVLITAAYNEADFIEQTIVSVINQVCKPIEWIIVNDGSTDRTVEVVKKYTEDNAFIKLLTNKRKDGRNFVSKVYALNLGIAAIQSSDYSYIGILDADVSFEPNYYSSLIDEFEKDLKLGIAGGNYFDIVKGKKIHVHPSPYSIRGATQFFRRDCFEQIGGIKPIKYGGEDALACYTARMYGWEIKNIKNLIVLHLRPTGTTGINIFKTRFRDGIKDYLLGYHPIFLIIKCLKRIFEKPFFLGSFLRLIGYFFSYMNNDTNNLPKNVINFIRNDQKNRLQKLFYK
jgi:glycosyltransferase involved in cell wall biosynthesis